ncbi:NUDIX domain-containing protein [Corynebacterium sp. 3HC-13]|uniref:NUDIX domain-containing protein n=1 Tax=Corynebacterium poyangense TaxID=2684405 RepID=UPI001CCF341B|nr:NUDIX hydrolase [Corynebacterium poyangense]MBZ8176527.1 NUDIX domain-containing protein [Corynebacterium poyangense]
MKGDGNGWSAAPNGGKAWGRYGAAGLCIYAPTTGEILLQHRAHWTNMGGTWALPGGARDSHESAETAALREAEEETGVRATQLQVRATIVTAGPFDADPTRPELAGGWTYSTVIAHTRSGEPVPVTPNEESLQLRWVPLDEVETYPLLPAFEESFASVKQIVAL